jgi:hypothetical protein
MLKTSNHMLKGYATLASPLFMPYVGFYSLPVALLSLLPNQAMMLAAIAGMWLIKIITGIPNL